MNKSTEKITRPQINTVIGVVTKFVDAIGDRLGDKTLGAQQLQLLMQLYVHGQLPQNELGKYTHVAASANSRNIAKLGDGEKPMEKNGPGWVEAYEDPADRRFKQVRLTPIGRSNLESAASEASLYLPKKSEYTEPTSI